MCKLMKFELLLPQPFGFIFLHDLIIFKWAKDTNILLSFRATLDIWIWNTNERVPLSKMHDCLSEVPANPIACTQCWICLFASGSVSLYKTPGIVVMGEVHFSRQCGHISAFLALCAGNLPSPHKGQWCGALMFEQTVKFPVIWDAMVIRGAMVLVCYRSYVPFI